MTHAKILLRAQELGIPTDHLEKDELVKVIQLMEGSFPCFQDSLFCTRTTCTWKDDCTALMIA